MKTLYKLIIIIIFASVFGSCEYLDVVPDNVATIDYAFRNRTSAEKYLFTCYSYRPVNGSLTNDPAMNGGDDTWWLYDIWGSPNPTQIARGFQNSINPYLNFWDGERGGKALFQGIRDCNIFLENIDQVADIEEFDKKRWIAEVKFLKAYYHYYLFKCYGPIPITDDNLPISTGVEDVKVYREPVDEVVDYIVSLLDTAFIDLPIYDNVIEGTEAGRVYNLVAKTLKAEVLLFAASPLFNGNTDYASMIDNRGVQLFPQNYDENKWQLAADACKEAIDLCHEQNKTLYEVIDPTVVLAPEVFQQQTMYREAICDKWNHELIWGGTNHDSRWLSIQAQAKIIRLGSESFSLARTEWAPTLKMAQLYYSANGVPIDEDMEWQNKGWYENRLKVREEPSVGDEVYYVKENEKTVYLHYNRENRFYASLGFDKGIYFGNGYTTWPDNVKYCDFFTKGHSGRASSGLYSITGYSVKKMHSFKNAQTTTGASYLYFPFPTYRLADLYLMYAEALNEATGPSDEVYNYLDRVRERAGLEGVIESWSNYSIKPDKPNSKSGLREIIHNERNIELAFEGKRFWDIRRWKKIEEFNEQPQGWNIAGETHEDFYKPTVVAREPIQFTVKDYFMPIKEFDLTVNSNLIQNYGW